MESRKLSYSRILVVIIVAIVAIFTIDYVRRNFILPSSDGDEPFPDTYQLIETTSEYAHENSGDNQQHIVSIDMNNYTFVECDYGMIAKGELSVVNKKHKSQFPNIEQELITFPYRKERTYRVADYVELKIYENVVEAVENMLRDFHAETACHDITITAGYRTSEKQSEALATGYSKDESGVSEHHTGYAVDFKVVTDDKKISLLENSGIFSWIYENSYKYGLVQRYTEDKAYATDTLARSYHFRYVGLAHAFYMHQNNLCLEEYIDNLKEYSFSNMHLEINTDSSAYEVYYIQAENEGSTKVYVPKNAEYSISGNNIDGFIVTVLKGTSKIPEETSVPQTETEVQTSVS